MNHEQRIKKLEKEIQNLKSIIKAAGLLDKFVPLPLAAEQLGISHWVLRRRIKADKNLVYGKHFKMNGNRYLINVEQYQKLIAADVLAMRR